MISQTAEYALRAVVWLAAHTDTPQTTNAIARATHVRPGYLSKVLQTLGRARIVHSQPGPGGGFRLVPGPAELTVLQVVNAVDPVRRIESCPLGLPTHAGGLCPLHRRLDEAQAMVEAAFAGVTVADLCSTEGAPPLCSEDGP